MNKKAQGTSMLVGILVMALTLAIFIATIPMLKDVIDIARESGNLNCNGYNHTTDASKSYNASLDSEDLACTILGLGIPYIVLAVLFTVIIKLIHGKMTAEPVMPQYAGYGYGPY
jgi:ribose/xylose/arabinose/galactoside ABC-type transport system permease subunit